MEQRNSFKPKVSVILPVLITDNKQLSTTLKCINLALRETRILFQLIIVETGTCYLEHFADKHIFIPNKTVSTRDINAGFQVADGEYVVLLTNDVYVDDGWIEALLDTFQKKTDCGIATLASTQFNDKKYRGRIEFGVWCSVFMTKNEFFKKYGYFDEINFPSVWDDTDFIMRLALNGLQPYKNYGCVVHHKVGMTEYNNPEHEKLFIENGNKFREKYNGCGHLLYDYLK